MKWVALFGFVLSAACASTTAGVAPVRGTIVVDAIHCYFLQAVRFDKGSARVVGGSEEIVESLAAAMKNDRDNFGLVEVAGHASADESDAVALSTQRASATRDALIARGVEGSRLRAKGYGAFCTLGDSADADEGAYRDRRVEVKVLRTKSGDSGVELGCDAARSGGIP